MTENKLLVFDMDGTIADFYGVEGWLDDLTARRVRPYHNAKPIWDTDVLNELLSILKDMGWRIVVTSWLAKDSCYSYDEKVRKSKKWWLDHYKFPYDEIHLVKYGTTKANCTRKYGGRQILIDDNAKVRKGWKGETIDPTTENLLEKLADLILGVA